MTSTKIIDNQDLIAAGGELLLPVKHTFASTTGAYALEIQITNSTTPIATARREVVVQFAPSHTDGVAATVAADAINQCEEKTVALRPGRSAKTVVHTDVFPSVGSYLYVWVNGPLLPAVSKISVWVVEF